MPGDQLRHSLQFLILVFARVTTFPVSEKVPAFLKYSDFENIYPKWEAPVTFCRLKGAKDPPPAHSPFLQPLFSHMLQLLPSKALCLFFPEYCPKHPLPLCLSGVGDFARRFFKCSLLGQGGATFTGAPFVSLLVLTSVQGPVHVPDSHLSLDKLRPPASL